MFKFLSGLGSKIGGLLGGLGKAGAGASKLGSIQSGVQKLGSVANIVGKLGIGGPTLQRIASGISKLPLEDIGKTAQQAFDVGKQIYETGKQVKQAFNKPQPAQMEVKPVAIGGVGQRVVELEDL